MTCNGYNMDLTGKVALVTGGTKGIGRAIAIQMVHLGAKVAVSYSSDEAAAQAVVAEAGKDRLLAVKADAGNEQDMESVVQAVVARWGQVDMLVPNAGIIPLKTVAQATPADFDRAYAVNVKGPFFLIQKTLPHMPAGSAVVNISTNLCHAGNVFGGFSLYVPTKGAIEQLTRVLARDQDLVARGIRVNAVAPGPTDTESFSAGRSQEYIDHAAALSPFKRLGTPADIAGVVCFLASEQARWLTGQLVKANGGII